MQQIRTRKISSGNGKKLPMTILPATAASGGDGFTVYIETVKLKKRPRA